MNEIHFLLLTSGFYLLSTVLHILNVKPDRSIHKIWLNGSVIIGIIFHITLIYKQIIVDDGVRLDLSEASLLISAFIILLTVILSVRLPLEKLFIVILPFACMVLFAAYLAPDSNKPTSQYSYGVLSHIILSILAYSTLVITTLDALLVAWQNSALKQHRAERLIAKMPSLQAMEQVLFSLLWVGMILLTLAILSGFLFIEDVFAQHLVHKTVLSIVAWCVYLIVLTGHHLWGWRGLTATYWIIAGFFMLMLAYFGSKFVLEVLLHRY